MTSNTAVNGKKVSLIPDWRRAWRFFSVQAMVVSVAIQGAWASLPKEMIDTIPDGWVRGATIALLMLGVIGRLVAQQE